MYLCIGKVEIDSSATTFMGAPHERTVNSGELSGLIAAMLWIQLQPIQKAIYVFSDSQYALGQRVGNNASAINENKAIVQRGQKLLNSIKGQRQSVLADTSNMWAGNLEFSHIKGHSGHPLNDFADDLAKRGADEEECYEGLHECIVKINTGNSRIKFGGSKTLADRYPELLSEGNDAYGRVVGMDGRNTYLVQWYVQNAQKGCIYSHEGSEILKLGDGLEAATRGSFSEEIRIGFPRLTVNSQWAQELGEERRAQPSPKRTQKGIDGDVRDSPSCSQSQGDESRTIGDGIREKVSSIGRGRKRGSTNEKRSKHTSPNPSQGNGLQDSIDSSTMDA
jgi:ribonuclease HI